MFGVIMCCCSMVFSDKFGLAPVACLYVLVEAALGRIKARVRLSTAYCMRQSEAQVRSRQLSCSVFAAMSASFDGSKDLRACVADRTAVPDRPVAHARPGSTSAACVAVT